MDQGVIVNSYTRQKPKPKNQPEKDRVLNALLDQMMPVYLERELEKGKFDVV